MKNEPLNLHHIKRVLTCLCIAGAFFGENTANAIVHTEPFIKDVLGKTSPLGQPTDSDMNMIELVISGTEVDARKEILEKIISTLDGLAAENTVNANMDPKTPNLSTRQKGVLELVQVSRPVIEGMVQWKEFDQKARSAQKSKDRIEIKGSLKKMLPMNMNKIVSKPLPQSGINSQLVRK